MERRTYESPMDWEYQTHGPMDPSSPFVQSARRAQQQKEPQASTNIFGGALGRSNPLTNIQSTPSSSKQAPATPSQPSSIFSTSHINRTTTAPPFRNPAFTTPRKPFDVDTFSEASAAESSPAVTDNSDFGETPDNDRSYHLDQMTITPASMHRNKNLFGKKQSGKGEIMHTVFSNRDKVRKRKRFNDNKDISGYRLPYRQLDEWDETDYDSDESTTEPARPGPRHSSSSRKRSAARRPKDGWLGNFLSVIQRHPHAPAIMSYWLNTLCNFVMVFGAFYLGWTIWAGFREDFILARRRAKDGILAEIQRCTSNYKQNKCYPLEQRLPAVHQMCEDWYECMIQNENGTKTINTVVLELVEILNSAIMMMHWKTMLVLITSILAVIYSGFSLYKNAGSASGYLRQPPPPPPPTPYPSSVYYPHQPERIVWEHIEPQTPSRHFNPRHLAQSEDTPETDASPPALPLPRSAFRALAPGAPHTPSSSSFLRSGRSPMKMMTDRDREWERERGRSPTKSRSPVKRY